MARGQRTARRRSDTHHRSPEAEHLGPGLLRLAKQLGPSDDATADRGAGRGDSPASPSGRAFGACSIVDEAWERRVRGLRRPASRTRAMSQSHVPIPRRRLRSR